MAISLRRLDTSVMVINGGMLINNFQTISF